MQRWRYIVALLAVVSGAQADELALTGGKTVTGRFQGYTAGRFVFVTSAGRTIRELPDSVKDMTLSPPANASVVLVPDQTMNGLRLSAYTNSAFVLIGASAPLNLRIGKVKRVELLFDPDRVAEDSPTRVISHGEVVAIKEFIRKGVVTVVQFHLPSSVASVRQGHYVERLAEKSHGQIVVLRVEVPNWDAPICAALNITSLPQFWFYSRAGLLTKKLTARFTESDLDGALREAQQGSD